MPVIKANGTTTDAATILIKDIENKNGTVEKKVYQIEEHDKHKEELTNEEDEITLEDLAPDGGWGWMVALGMILTQITIIGPQSSFGILFGDFLVESGMEGIALSLFNAVFMITCSIAGLFANMLLKKYSARPVGIVGALFTSLPNIFLTFVRNIYDMAFLFFLQGFGFGLILPICNTVFNSYFVKRRAKVTNASHVIIALGGIIFPPLTRKLMIMYGVRGTTAIIGALGLNTIPSMLLLHPVIWHARPLKEILAEKRGFASFPEKAHEKEKRFEKSAPSNRHSTIDIIHVSLKSKWSSLHSLKEGSCTGTPLLNETIKKSAQRVASISEIDCGFREKAITQLPIKKNLTQSTSSLINLINMTSHIEELRQRFREKTSTKEKERKGYLKEILDMSLVKNWAFMNLICGVNFVLNADYAFSVFLPIMMTDVGYSKDNATLAVVINGVVEMISKILLAVFSFAVNVKARYIFFTGTVFMELARLGFLLLYDNTFVGGLIMTAMISAVRSLLTVQQSLVIIEDVRIEKHASAYGISIVLSGLVTVIFGTLVGFIKDWTHSFKIYQISLLVMNAVFIIPWTLQFILIDFRKRSSSRSVTHTKS